MLVRVGMPGIKARGYLVEEGDAPLANAQRERETFTCCHCGGLTAIPHRAAPESLGRFCQQCNQMTCVKCGQDPECRSLRRRIDESLVAHSRRAQY